MMNVKGTASEKNILAAFAGESQARNRYTYFAEAARKEGNEEVGELFERMAKNELAHAKIWFTMLNPTKSSAENLVTAAMGEGYESRDMYPKFAEQARQDGLPELAAMFEKVGEIERSHEKTFMEMLSKLTGTAAPVVEENEVAPLPKANYRCMFCGNESVDRPDVCPVCQAIGAFEKI